MVLKSKHNFIFTFCYNEDYNPGIIKIDLLFFWYYISMFGIIYRNTQYHLLKDTLISFGISFFYPFGINLIPGIFRIPSLSNPKKKRTCLYNFSKILQLL